MALDSVIRTRNPNETLRKQFNPYKMFDGSHDLIPASRLQEVLIWMEILGLNIKSTKVLDLGAGNGWPVAVFAYAGYSAYGIEKEAALVQQAEPIFSFLGINAEVIQGDYYSPQFQITQFRDGTKLEDINFVFCYSYDTDRLGEVVHTVRLIKEVLSGTERFARGTIFYLDSLYSISYLDELVRSHGFNRIPGLPSRFIRKNDYFPL